MDGQQYGKLFSFIWNIANDVLVFAFEKGDYKKIILPFTVLRRIDVLLEETKAKVLEKKAFCDKNKLPYEQIPLTYPGGIAAFYEKEVKPYDAEATFGEPVVGYELSFTKYFYKPVELRTQDEIAAEISSLEKETSGLLREILS